MPIKTTLKISRRDAVKILAAAGAATLAGLPGKWAKPVLHFGALPVHAQTSAIRRALICQASKVVRIIGIGPVTDTSQVQISPAAGGININYSIVTGGGMTLISPAASGSVATNGSGIASITFSADPGTVAAA